MSITVTLVGEATLGSAGVAVRRYRAPTSAPRKRDVNVDQLQLDQLRMQEIKASNFQGREYQELVDDLWIYGMRALKGLIRSGEIFKLCSGRGLDLVDYTQGDQDVLRGSQEARDQIAVGTLTAAVPGFVDDVLKPEKWSSTPKQPRRRKGAGTTRRPATIRTFFVGYCLYDFANEYRRWARRRRRELAALDHQFAAQAEKPSAARNPADVTADRDTLRRILEVATPEARVICGLILQSRTRLEIGQAIGGLSERAVEGHMRRLRTAVRRMAGTGEIEVPPGWAAATGATA